LNIFLHLELVFDMPFISCQIVEKDQLMGLPNLLPYDAVLETVSHGFAIRQYIHSSLYDRIRFVFAELNGEM
jgi:hypothetical protein